MHILPDIFLRSNLNFRVSDVVAGPPETFGDGARAAILPHVFARPVASGMRVPPPNGPCI